MKQGSVLLLTLLTCCVFAAVNVSGAVLYVDGSSGMNANSGTGASSAKRTIQAAIDVARPGDTILVAPGAYGAIDTQGKDITIRSTDGAEKTKIVSDTRREITAAMLMSDEYDRKIGEGESFEYDVMEEWVTWTPADIPGSTLEGFTVQLDGREDCVGILGGRIKNCRLLCDNNYDKYFVLMQVGVAENCLIVAGYFGHDNELLSDSILRSCTVYTGSQICDSEMENTIVYARRGSVSLEGLGVAPLSNCVFFGVKGVAGRAGVTIADPQFVDAVNGDFTLRRTSPCIDKGGTAYGTTDLAGNPRVSNGKVDIGCYEYQGKPFSDRVAVNAVVAEGCEGMGTVSGGGRAVKTGTKVTVRATAKRGFAFAGWYAGETFVSMAASYSFVVSGDESMLQAVFVAAEDDSLGMDWGVSEQNDVHVPLSEEDMVRVYSFSVPTINVRGLPPGVKYRLEHADFYGDNWVDVVLYGTPTKEGIYYPVCTAKNGNGYTCSQTFKMVIGNPPDPDYNNTELDLESFDKWLQTGDVFNCWLHYHYTDKSVFDPTVPYITKISASGLPIGLKLNSVTTWWMQGWEIAGMPTKPGKYTVTFTVTYSNRKSYRAVKTVIVYDAGCRYLHVQAGEGYEDRGTASGAGVRAIGSKVRVTARANRNYFFAGWYLDSECQKRAYMVSGDWRKAADSYLMSDDYEQDRTHLYAKFVSKAEDVGIGINFKGIVEEDGGVATWNVGGMPGSSIYSDCSFEVDSESLPTVTVSGLPPGCKWDRASNRLVFEKQPTRPGMTRVTIKAKNLSGAVVERQLYVKVPNLRSAVFDGLEYEEAYRFRQGVSDACVPFWCEFSVESGWTVTAGGLPPGLKFVFDKELSRGYITGTPTKAGVVVVTFTARKGRQIEKATASFIVDPLPDYAVGTFNGLVKNGDTCIGVFAMTATSAGRLSASLTLLDGTRKSYSANSWNCADDGTYYGYFWKPASRGPCTEEGEWIRLAVGNGAWDECQLTGEFAFDSCNDMHQGTIEAQRNAFRKVGRDYENEEAHAIAATLNGFGKMVAFAGEIGDEHGRFDLSCPECCVVDSPWAGILTFTVALDGTIRMSGKIAGKGVSGSAVLRVLDGQPQADFCLYVSRVPIRVHVDIGTDYGAKGAVNGWATVGRID